MSIKNNIDSFDLSKLILSLLVITIHIPLLSDYLNPIARIAVPLFFMMSSYFFFGKINAAPKQERSNALKQFLLRNIKLYVFWFIVLLPITLYLRNYFADGFLTGLLRFLQDLLFYSTFRASWYITALCISVTIICFLSNKISNRVLLAISFVFFIFFVFIPIITVLSAAHRSW